MMECSHESVNIVNWYELVPKYECNQCGHILICECERHCSARLLPHQTQWAGGPGHWRVAVDGFAEEICHHCRDIPLPPAPRAKLPNQKGKVQRYYWREIQHLKCKTLVAWMDTQGICMDLHELQMQYPEVVAEAEREARCHWQQEHRRAPRYTTQERNQEEFLQQIPVNVTELKAPYVVYIAKNGHRLGRYKAPNGRLLQVEELAQSHFEAEGWTASYCEYRLITALYSVLLHLVFVDANDSQLMTGYRHSTQPSTASTKIAIIMPDDFGTPANYKRRRDAYEATFARLRESDIRQEFVAQIEQSAMMGDYLSIHEPEIELAKVALATIPSDVACTMIKWVAQDFWSRQHGWPDLLLLRGHEYRFVEVKSRKDRLSQEQMMWYEWAIGEDIPCEILRVLPSEEPE